MWYIESKRASLYWRIEAAQICRAAKHDVMTAHL
jgi:hypothetical protein